MNQRLNGLDDRLIDQLEPIIKHIERIMQKESYMTISGHAIKGLDKDVADDCMRCC